MSETLCTLRKKGGGEKGFDETVLWTNSAPTSNFAAQTVTISDDMDNYDFIKFNYRHNTSVSTEYSQLYTVSDVKSAVNASVNCNSINLGVHNSDASSYARYGYYVSDTQIGFLTGYRLGATNTSQGVAIPTSIVGCKFK